MMVDVKDLTGWRSLHSIGSDNSLWEGWDGPCGSLEIGIGTSRSGQARLEYGMWVQG